MPLVTARALSKSYGPKSLFKDAAFSIHGGQRVGLVGVNGSGKSTLARIVAGLEEPDGGEISRRRGATTEYLAQEPEFEPHRTARQIVLGGLAHWTEAKQRYERLSEQITRGIGDLEDVTRQQAEAAHAVERAGGWELSSRADAMLTELGIERLDQSLGSMSGGERRRVALARLLVAKPDLAVLDEPTNHLDIDAIEWLENYLMQSFQGALLLVTHDRYFLDRLVDRTFEIEGGALYRYDGGWEQYLTAKAERAELEARTEANRQNFLRRELEWLRRQPKARTGKQKARIARAEAALEAGPAEKASALSLSLGSARMGKQILEVEGLGLEIGGRSLIQSLTLHLSAGECIGIVGKNGTGKTSLLRCLNRELPPSRGSVKPGKNTRVAYFDQTRSGLDESASILENVAGERRVLSFRGRDISVFSYLERFQFRSDKIQQAVGSLSGGERARVALAKLLLATANVLLLDEPTNDLDTSTLSALEDMLRNFDGTVLVVTHDRYLLDRLASSILAFLGDGRVERYPGNFAAYKEKRAAELTEAKQARDEQDRAVGKAMTAPAKSGRLSYAERIELDGLMTAIEQTEANVQVLETRLADPETYRGDASDIRSLNAELAASRQLLERQMQRWEELEAKRG